jgi:hypothetical protein
LLVRRAACASGAEREALRKQSAAWLALEAARGDSIHAREARCWRWTAGTRTPHWHQRRRTFACRRNSPTYGCWPLAVAAHDARARQQLEQWLRSTGYRDA